VSEGRLTRILGPGSRRAGRYLRRGALIAWVGLLGGAAYGGASLIDHGTPHLPPSLHWETLARGTGAEGAAGSNAPVDAKKAATALSALDGQAVQITGFIYPLQPGDASHFLLSAMPSICQFCLPAGPDQLIEVQAEQSVPYTSEPVRVAGQLELLEDDPSGLYYRLHRAVIGEAQAQEAAPGRGRTIVLGFDGMDPELTERWMADGVLPNFARLAREGHYQPLATTNPAQSPVAWSSFATGLNPGEHGIFDFLRRDAATYAPEYAISSVEPPGTVLRAFGFQLPLDEGAVRNRRVGTPFWFSAEREGHPSSVLRVPVTYPADPITSMLSGMGVPDLLGTQGTFTFYTTEAAEGETTGGRIVTVEVAGDRVETTLEGPPHPLYQKPVPLAIPLTIEATAADRVRITLGGQELELATGDWSDWASATFSFAGLLDVRGLVRFYLVEAFPELKLYVSPIQFDPRAPAGPISMPAGYAGQLAERIGLFHTLGMPEETWSLNEERISDEAWLEMVATILKEREAMLFDALESEDRELVVAVFVQTDRVSHMFWRGIDPEHPLYDQTDERARGAIEWIYREADRILGRVRDAMEPEDRLIVLSDHGFDSFRRAVHLNRWLAEEGYLALKPGAPSSESLFTNVDWTKTRAFALGLNGIFVNLRGREALGIVRPEDTDALKREISDRLKGWRDPETGDPVVVSAYDGAEVYRGAQTADAPDLVIGYGGGYRASWQTALGGVPELLIEDNTRKWSGDHCIDPPLVPGVLFTSFKPEAEVASITEVPNLVRGTMGLTGVVDPAEVGASRGVFDLASPAFGGIDRVMTGWVPQWGRLAVWGLVAAFVSMGLYRLTSNQKRLAVNKKELAALQKRLADFDGPMSGLWPLLGRNFALAGHQLWLSLVPAVIASVPVIFILAWASNAFDARAPEVGSAVQVEAHPSDGRSLPPLRWRGDGAAAQAADGVWNVAWPAAERPLELIDSDGTVLLTLPMAAPVGTVHQRRWWNALVGNPAGYLPSPGDVDTVELGLPRSEFLPFGPGWLRGWIAWFFGVVIVMSLALKFLWRLH
jgi:predicted AlkP superfamily phosphohydrolase/phosphomutase